MSCLKLWAFASTGVFIAHLIIFIFTGDLSSASFASLIRGIYYLGLGIFMAKHFLIGIK